MLGFPNFFEVKSARKTFIDLLWLLLGFAKMFCSVLVTFIGLEVDQIIIPDGGFVPKGKIVHLKLLFRSSFSNLI